MEFIFWASIGVLGYVYLGYPLVAWLCGLLVRRTVSKGRYQPFVSIVIAAHNEERTLAATIENKLSLDYPSAKREIIVVSDASTDGTDEIARTFVSRGVAVIRQESRNGKAAALNLAVQRARGDVLVFADANSIYDRSALRHLVENFADPAVGYVTGTLVYLSESRSMTAEGCTLYMQYENFVRLSETRSGSIVGVNGGIDAMRRSQYRPMKPDDLPDLVLPLAVVRNGYRVVYEPAAMLAEVPLASPHDEYRMRVRVALRALWTLAEMHDLLDVRRHGLYSVQLFSHKVLRYLACLFMVPLYATSLVLWPRSALYEFALAVQTVGLVLAAAGYSAARMTAPARILAVPYYFVLVNCAALHACWKFLSGERPRVWTPRLG